MFIELQMSIVYKENHVFKFFKFFGDKIKY